MPATPHPVPDALARAIAWPSIAAGRWRGEVTPDWLQGRGAFGGLQAAVALRALQSLVDPDRLPRSMTVHFAAPLLPGPAELLAQIERVGGNITHASARIVQGTDGTPAAPVALVLATFGRAREHWFTVPPEAAPPLREARPLRMPPTPGIPAFTQHLEIDLTEGYPYSGSDTPRVSGWVRFPGRTRLDAPLLAALADAWPPAAVACMRAPRPSSSVDLSYQFLRPTPLHGVDPEGFFSFSAHAPAGGDGYSEERGQLWAPDGGLALRVRQLRAVY